MEKYLGTIQLLRPSPARSSISPAILSSIPMTEASSKAARKPFSRTSAANANDGKVKEKQANSTKIRIRSKQSGRRASRRVAKQMPPSLPTVDENDNEITYTPITHRPSKAKKGKKVHQCEHPGCDKVSKGNWSISSPWLTIQKVFTRAEHRK